MLEIKKNHPDWKNTTARNKKPTYIISFMLLLDLFDTPNNPYKPLNVTENVTHHYDPRQVTITYSVPRDAWEPYDRGSWYGSPMKPLSFGETCVAKPVADDHDKYTSFHLYHSDETTAAYPLAVVSIFEDPQKNTEVRLPLVDPAKLAYPTFLERRFSLVKQAFNNLKAQS